MTTQENKMYFEALHELFRTKVEKISSGLLAIYMRDAQNVYEQIKSDSLIISNITKILLEEATEECIKRIESAGEIEDMLTDETEKQINDLLTEIEKAHTRELLEDKTN